MQPNRFYLFMSLFWLAGVSWFAVSFSNVMANHGTSVCFLKQTTGLACPSCGTTRSMQVLFEGNIWQAIYINPLGLLGFTALLIIPCWLFADSLNKKTTMLSCWNYLENSLKKPAIYWPAILLILANWTWNISKDL